MSVVKSVTQVQVESCVFPPKVKAPGSSKNFFLEDDAIPSLAVKWKGKIAEELTASDDFFKDIVTGNQSPPSGDVVIPINFYRRMQIPNSSLLHILYQLLFAAYFVGPFEKFTQVTMILPLTGQQYSEAVVRNCVAYWKAVGTYSDEESEATKKFLDVFKDETFPPGASILFTQSLGSSKISFSKDGSLPDKENAVIENKQLSEAVLESIIGKNGVSPEAKQSLGVRLSDLLNISTP